MGLFDYNFDESFIDIEYCDILQGAILKTLNDSCSLNNDINLTFMTVDNQSQNLYISNNDSVVNLKKNADDINVCPIFLISLYMFYNYHSLFDDEADISLNFWLKKGYKMLSLNLGNNDPASFEQLEKYNINNPKTDTNKTSDNPRFQIDLLEDEIEADEILFPWISFFKESIGENYATNKQIYTLEFKVFDNLINLSKSLLKDLIYLKVIQLDLSKTINKPGLKSFLDRFESFYSNEFIDKLVSHNTEKLMSLKLIDLSIPVTKSNTNDSLPNSINSTIEANNASLTEKSTNNDSINNFSSLEISTFLKTNQKVQETLLQEVTLLKNNMNQEFQNIKFQYNLQQQHLIKLEQQIQMFIMDNVSNNGSMKQETERRNSFSNPINLSNIQNNNIPANNFMMNTKLSPFISNSSINQVLNPNGNNNTTLQLLKNANYQGQTQGLTPSSFQINNGLKSNINSPGGLALLNKIASPQMPMNSGVMSTVLPNNNMYMNEGLTNNLKTKNSKSTDLRKNTLTNGYNAGNDNGLPVEKLPSLVDSMKMQPTFSEIISDLSNPTPNSGRSTIKPENPGAKRKLNKSMMLESRLPSVPQAMNMNKPDDMNDFDDEIGNKKSKISNDMMASKKANDKKTSKKSVANKDIKYRVFRGHKTIFDLCEEWYEGIPKVKVLEGQAKAMDNGDKDEVPIFKIKGLDNYDNSKLFSPIKKDDSDMRIQEIKAQYQSTKNEVERLESIKNLIQNYGWRKWKVTGDSHFFPKRRVVIDFIEEELKDGYKNGRFNVHVDDYNESRKVIICDLENFRLVNDLTLNNIAKLLKNVKKLSSKSIVKEDSEEGDEANTISGIADLKRLRREILFGADNFTMYDENNSNAIWYENDAGLKSRCVSVDGHKHVKKLEPAYIDTFCKVIIGGKV